MAAFYADTGGSALNSGSTDVAANGATGTTYLYSGAVGTDVTTVITLVGCTDDLSLLPLSGLTQATINLAASTVANRKIFKITAVDNVGKTVTVDQAPALTAGTSAWKIGGQFVWTAANIEAGLAAGDVVTINNSPAAAAADWITLRAAGSTAAGFIKVKGKTGVRPVINVTNTTQCIEGGANALWWFENLELDQDGASGDACKATGAGSVFYSMKVSDGGGYAFGLTSGAGQKVIASEITGTTDGLQMGGASLVYGTNIHDVSDDGADNIGGAGFIAENSIFDTCGGQAVNANGAVTGPAGYILLLSGNTIYGCGDSGLEVADADAPLVLLNNLFSENGNAAGEYNVEWVAGDAEKVSFHAWNGYHHSGGGGGANLLNLTVNAQVASSEFTTDPQFTNPSGADFSLGSASPAKAVGFPGQILGGNLGYLDMGAVQRQEPAGGSGGGQRVIGG